MPPLVSVIVPVYNAAPSLARCIESVRRQTYRHLEIILVNDGSHDTSLSICRMYAQVDGRITVIDKPNSGVSATRNVAIERAKGEYLQFVDSDDYLAPNATELLLERALETDGDLVIAHYWRVAEQEAEKEMKERLGASLYKSLSGLFKSEEGKGKEAREGGAASSFSKLLAKYLKGEEEPGAESADRGVARLAQLVAKYLRQPVEPREGGGISLLPKWWPFGEQGGKDPVYGFLDTQEVMDTRTFARHLMEEPASFYYGVMWNKLYRAELVRRHHIQCSEELGWSEDFLFNLEFIRYAERFCALTTPIYYYVKRPGSITATQIHLKEVLGVKHSLFLYYKDLYESLGLYDQYKLRVHKYLVASAES